MVSIKTMLPRYTVGGAGALLLIMIVAALSAETKAEQCVSYTPSTCLFGDVDIRKRHCHPSPCDFDIKVVC